MIGQPLGCILVLLIGMLSIAIGVAPLSIIGTVRSGFLSWNFSSLWPALVIGWFLFFPLVNFAH